MHYGHSKYDISTYWIGDNSNHENASKWLNIASPIINRRVSRVFTWNFSICGYLYVFFMSFYVKDILSKEQVFRSKLICWTPIETWNRGKTAANSGKLILTDVARVFLCISDHNQLVERSPSVFFISFDHGCTLTF